ncbi:MAG: dehydrogenase, partial [Planctomycetota bacterium]
MLEDKDGDGRAESSSVYVQDPDLTAPLGILVAPEGVYVSCSPNLFLYHDDDGDGKADRREVFLTGFGGHDHDHGLHSVVAYPGGGLLWCAGNAGPHVVRDSAGFVLRSGSVYNGGGASHPGNQPGLRSDDGRVWTGGLIGRLWRDGSGVAVLAHNFRNPYEVAVDVFGDMYTYDNDDDGNQGCRMVALTPGGDYGYFGDGGRTWWNADRREGLSTQEAHWHQGDPGVMPMGTVTGAGGPTGVTVYENPAWPAMQGRVLAADAGRGLIWAARTVERGAELALEPEVWLQPKPGSDGQVPRTFRPSDVAVGPDGAVYVADWFDPGVGGHHAADHDAYGRILRIVPPAERGTSDYDVEARLAQTIWWDLPPADNQPALPR